MEQQQYNGSAYSIGHRSGYRQYCWFSYYYVYYSYRLYRYYGVHGEPVTNEHPWYGSSLRRSEHNTERCNATGYMEQQQYRCSDHNTRYRSNDRRKRRQYNNNLYITNELYHHKDSDS